MNGESEKKDKKGGRVKLVEHLQPLAPALADFILAQGYGLSNTSGEKLKRKDVTRDDEAIGVLHGVDDSSTQAKKIMGIYKYPKNRRIFLGVVRIKESNRGASENNWAIDAFGRENLSRMQELAQKLSEEFDVDITLHLRSNEPRYEIFLDEFGE